jgi:hypothetical protein
MASKNTVPARISSEMYKDLSDVMKIRLQKGFIKNPRNEMTMPEMTNLFRRTQGYKIAMEELKTKPKKKNE